MSRKASCGRQRAEDKGDSGNAFLMMKRGQLFSLCRWVAPYIYMPLWMPRPCGSTTLFEQGSRHLLWNFGILEAHSKCALRKYVLG